MNAVAIIVSNFPHCEEWSDESFLGYLHECDEFNQEAYWQLEWAMLEYTKAGNKPYDLNWPIFRIFSCVMNSLAAHSEPRDGYKIKNVSYDFIWDFTERFQMVFEGFFKGEVPNLDKAFKEKNPLLGSDYFV
jgi:hypothetical protein